MRRRVLITSSMLLVALLAACSASGDSMAGAGSMAEGGSAVTMAQEPGGDGDAGGAADESLALGSAASDAAASREVITRGDVALAVDDPRAATAAVVALVERDGGRVDARSESAGTDGRDAVAWLTVRIPSGDMTSTLTALEEIGEVRQVDLTAEDVTGDVQDLDARIRAMRLSVARMEELLSRATTNSDIISAESALAERQATLESMQTQRARIAEEVALSTLTIQISTTPLIEAAPPSTGGFLGGLQAGWGALVSVLGGLLVVLGALLPWAVLGGVVAATAVAAVRLTRRRRASPPPAEDAATSV
ncbi:DUF4349 domain-containing protein [Cellulomonas timonensis]|uniref:DUF4349 domain-containing protein n=1 Tax=Cellulomonas timonensis TaxID=1689271 RepID=UPI00082B28CF|nr:DUF4349 domain-containing protein [Cellulomonas timonensis]